MTISPEDAEEYTQALGQVLSGGWRQRALAWRLGVPQALGMTLEEWTEHRLGGYVRMSIPERREAVAELTAEGLSSPAIAAVLGVSDQTVLNDRSKSLERGGELHAATCGADSKNLDTPIPDAADDAAGGYYQQQDDIHALLEGEPEPSEDLHEELESLDPGVKPAVHINEGDEWYTPKWLFDALGIKFSMDVCSPLDVTHNSVPAEMHLTIEDDGLAQPWQGTVWCNPPYSKPEPWARRLIHHKDGLLLTHMPMNAGWCVDVWEACDAIRLFQAMEFVRPDGSLQRPGYWLQLAAFGPVATEALARLQPLGDAAANKRRIASPMWRAA